MDKLLTLLSLQRLAQEAQNFDALGHVITNETLQITPYKQAVLWSNSGLSPKLTAVSGNAQMDDKSSYALALIKLIKNAAFKAPSSDDTVIIFTPNDLTPHSEHWNASHAALLIFKTPKDGILGGLWLERDAKFAQGDVQLLSELTQSYTHAMALLQLRDRSLISSALKNLRKAPSHIILALILIALIPVKLSITAPAEIIAFNPAIVSAPYDSKIDKVLVKPGDLVSKGQVLLQMDQLELSARMNIVAQELDVARANLSRLRRESLASPEKKIELKKLEFNIAAKQIEFKYAKDQMQRAEITSPANGIAIFSDASSLQGKPVRMGEKIMQVANEKDSEILIRVPVHAMIPITKEASTKFFLNVSPLSRHSAKIYSIGYQASADNDGLLSYKIHAKPDENTPDIRIGWKGTAKIYSDWSILGYAMLRAPLASLRQLLGI